ncbi:MAG: Rrf2 family transcriptional regulator [Oscillospiraceae bacterium]|nr:Rrf2 family transcriptional regulator [Oscillospiraceae bacterium]
MISTKGRYALRLMLDLAEHDTDGFIPLKDVADRQQLSKKYLEIIVRDLVGAKLVTGVSGKGGGYCLCRKPEEYSVGEILEVTEGSLATVACLADGAVPCPRASDCPTLSLWTDYNRLTHDYFYGKRLSDLIVNSGR